MLKKIKDFLKTKKEKPRDVYKHIDEMFDTFKQEVILVELGEDISVYGDVLCEIIWDFRDELKTNTGFIFPAVSMKSNFDLQENEFTVKIHNNVIYNEFIIPNKEKCIEEFKKVLKFIYDEHLSEIFTNESVEKYISYAQKENGWLMWNLSCKLSTSEIKIILEDLLKKSKNLNNITHIFEKISETIYVEKRGEIGTNLHKLSEEIAALL